MFHCLFVFLEYLFFYVYDVTGKTSSFKKIDININLTAFFKKSKKFLF